MLIHGIIHVLSYRVPCKSVHVKRCNHRHYQGRLMGQQTHVLWMVNHWLETVSQRFVAFNVLELLWFPGLGSKDAETTFIKMLLIIDQVLVFKPGRTRPLLRTNAFVFFESNKAPNEFPVTRDDALIPFPPPHIGTPFNNTEDQSSYAWLILCSCSIHQQRDE